MSDILSLTSDFDYLKIFDDNTVLITTTTPTDSDFQFPVDPFGGFGSGEQGIVPIFHGLGTVPLVRAFIDPAANGMWYSSQFVNGFITIDPDLLTLVDTANLKLCVNSFGGHKANIPVFYRIYYPGVKGVDSDTRIDKIFAKNPAGFYVDCGAAADSADPVQAEGSVAHSQNEAILWTMQFSEDGNTWYNDGNFIYGPPDTNSGPPGGPYSYYYYTRAYARADNNTFYVRVESNYATTKRLYFRWTLDYRT
jgi:hypothetical protein